MPVAPFRTSERVRWADVDLVGIMRFSAVPRFVELAEQEIMRAAGLPYRDIFEAPEVWLPRRHLSIDYLSPARLDDLLSVTVYMTRLGTTSATMQVDLHAESGRIVAAAAMTVVCVGATDFRKQPLPASLVEALTPFLCSVDEARASHGGNG
jgi:acyl-CoA thioester hydrolase